MQRWSQFISRTSLIWLIAWPVLGIAIWAPAPRIAHLLKDDDTGFLPPSMDSQRAVALLKNEFPHDAPASRAAIVFVRDSGLTEDDRKAIAQVARELAADSDEREWHIIATALAPHLQPILESPDGKATLVVVDLPADLLTHHTVERTREIRALLSAQVFADGLQVEVTGSGALGEMLDRHTKRDVDRTTLWAFAAVMVILLLIYRSPIAMLLPIVTIALGLMVGLGLVGWGASVGWPINGLVQMIIIVIVVGSGVDYCLFLFARFREEMSTGKEVREAVESALNRCGGAILASAGTNAAGLATLALGGNRDLYTSGPTIAFCICVGTLAVMTLTPALLHWVGRFLFWPARTPVGEEREGRLWHWAGHVTTHRPVACIGVTLICMIPLAFIGWNVRLLYDSYEEYPPDSSFVRGAHLYYEHFYGEPDVSEQTMLLTLDAKINTPEADTALKKALDEIETALKKRFDVVYVRDLTQPLGKAPDGSNRMPPGIPAVVGGLVESMARDAYIGDSGTTARIDYGIAVGSRSVEAMEMIPEIRRFARAAAVDSGLLAAVGGEDLRIEIGGETSMYRDIRNLRRRDFTVVGTAAITVIFLILVWLIRSAVESLILVAATLLTYLASYGATYLIFNAWFGLEGLGYQVRFMLFVIILSLGQDYNIYVVTRIREEMARLHPREAVALAVRRTGRVVSSCGIIMAATFFSMISGALMLMKELAVAFALGILIDTFVVRPLLVPAMIYLRSRFRQPEREIVREPVPETAGTG